MKFLVDPVTGFRCIQYYFFLLKPRKQWLKHLNQIPDYAVTGMIFDTEFSRPVNLLKIIILDSAKRNVKFQIMIFFIFEGIG